MTLLKTTLVGAALLTTLGLAGCQTTEERVYYEGGPRPVVVDQTVVYGSPSYRYRRPPPPIYVTPPPRYYGGPTRWEPPRRWDGPSRPPRYEPGGPGVGRPQVRPGPYMGGPTRYRPPNTDIGTP